MRGRANVKFTYFALWRNHHSFSSRRPPSNYGQDPRSRVKEEQKECKMKKEYGRQAYFFVGTHPCQGWTAKFKPFCNMFSPSIINLFMYLGYLAKKIDLFLVNPEYHKFSVLHWWPDISIWFSVSHSRAHYGTLDALEGL